ncbi:MAG: NADH-quinone oxidoreductase subunit L [Dehalococcoidia bacterium]
MPNIVPWLIFLLPFASFLLIGLILRPFFNKWPKVSGYVTIGAVGLSCALAFWVLFAVMGAPGHKLLVDDIQWAVIGSLNIHIGVLVDALTAVMVVVVTFVSLMVQIYSQGYMKGDPGYPRYYAFMSLFTACMLGLVLANNILFMFVFWEGVGLGSYLLIGFWFHKPSAANAAKKAFIVTRAGDFGFLAAILLLYAQTGTFDTQTLYNLVATGALAGSVLTWVAIGIFAGAAGKSAQFPLHVWLPDAMEGPTPVSSLIHAATMVAAGVFLVARFYPLFQHSAEAMTTVAVIGAFTAIFAASMGLVMNDIKRVLAYSTISQLGYMMLGLGVGSVAIGIFHLFTHAFFKCLLFLGSGSVNHGTGTFDMRLMGGLRKVMPWTYATFVIGSLSLAGIWPLAGFWSKDQILVSALTNNPVLFTLAIVTVFMTAFYMFRAVFMTFHGEYKGGAVPEHGGHDEHSHGPHESPAVMVAPMVVLAALAICAGWFNVTGGFSQLMGSEAEETNVIASLLGVFTHPLPLISLIVALLGIFLAYAMYLKKWISPEKIGNAVKPVYTLLYRKYFMDELYENVFVKTILYNGIFKLMAIFDYTIVDGTVNGVANRTAGAGGVLRKIQNGQTQLYVISIAIGAIAIAICVYLFH